ncbi:MAG: Leu/Phe/Val dehydrogenase [Sphingomonadaceae bacterium]
MTALWELPDFDDHELVHFVTDRRSGLRAIIAVHSTHLGPGAGGVRFWHYAEPADAFADVLRLSRGMSYKNAMADLPLGGGKAVILADENFTKTPAMLAAYGRAVEALGGRYITAEDVGMSVADLVAIAKETPHVSGLPAEEGEVGGDPGPHTAYGVYLGVKAAARRKLGTDSLAGVRIALQGAGSVGSRVARHAAQEGARLAIADIDPARAAALAGEAGGTVVDARGILSTEADIFCPCALGAILDERSIPELKAAVVAGGANNQLATPADGERLAARDILYAPDYVINAGGIINVASEHLGLTGKDGVRENIERIPGRLREIWDESDASGHHPAEVADAIAQRRIGRGGA